MPRDISSGMLTPLTSNAIYPAFLAMITFKSQTVYCWTGVGSFVYGGNTYIGVGDLGKIAPIVEGSDIQAYGCSISLSAIDPNLLAESLTDIQVGAPVTLYFALFNVATGTVFGTPYPVFVGTVDKPTVNLGTQQMTITLALENRLANLQRANQRKYTSADQLYYYPDDSAFNWVESLNDQALRWNA